MAGAPEDAEERQPMARPAGLPSPLRIGELLLRRAFIDQDDLALALAEQELSSHSPPLGRLLVRLGAIDEDVLTVTLAEQSGMPVVNLHQEPAPDPSALDRIPRETAYRLQALPMRYVEGRLVIALAEPPTRALRREILSVSGRQPDFVLANASVLADAIARWFPHPSQAAVQPFDGAETTIDVEPRPDERPARPREVRDPRTTQPLADASVHFQPDGRVNVDGKLHDAPHFRAENCVSEMPSSQYLSAAPPVSEPEQVANIELRAHDRVVTWLLAHADDVGASSVHVIEESPEFRVRVRIDGTMRDTTKLPAVAGNILVRRLLRATGLEIDAHATQSGWLRSSLPGFGTTLLHVRTALTSSGRTVVVRSMDPEWAGRHRAPPQNH